MQAGPHHYRRAAAAWAVRRWLLIAAERGRLLTGPRPHWWPLLHLLAVFVALCSGLCDLSDSRRQCMAATTSVVAVISVLNIVPMVIALRWGLQPRAHASSTQPGTEHSAVTASDEAPVKGETVPLNPHDVRTRVMSASHAWLHPVRKFLKIPHRSGEYTVSQGTHLFQGRDLPVLVQLRRDGSPDLPPLKIPEDIQVRSSGGAWPCALFQLPVQHLAKCSCGQVFRLKLWVGAGRCASREGFTQKHAHEYGSTQEHGCHICPGRR